MEIVLFISMTALAAVIAGVLAGLLGIGGGIVLVPALYLLFSWAGVAPDILMQCALGTSLATILFTGLSSARGHQRKGALEISVLKAFVPPIMLGVLIGTAIAASAPSGALSLFFGIVILAVALWMALRSKQDATGDFRSPSTGIWWIFGTGIGALSGLMGIGGGTFTVPTMTHFGLSAHKAVGTASAIGVFIGLVGLAGYMLAGAGIDGRPLWSVGYVNLIALALIVPVSMSTARIGVWLAHRLSERLVKLMFSGFLLLAGSRMLWAGYSQLFL